MNKADAGEIARRAYTIWEREGRPHGRDFEHWLKAEREIQAEKPGRRSRTSSTLPAKAAGTTARKPSRAKKTRS